MALPWRRSTHAHFGPAFNRAAAALLLGARRLAAAGAAPDMDPAVLEEMFGYVKFIRMPVAHYLTFRQAPFAAATCAKMRRGPGGSPVGAVGVRPAEVFIVTVTLDKSVSTQPSYPGAHRMPNIVQVGFASMESSYTHFSIHLKYNQQERDAESSYLFAWDPATGCCQIHRVRGMVKCSVANKKCPAWDDGALMRFIRKHFGGRHPRMHPYVSLYGKGTIVEIHVPPS